MEVKCIWTYDNNESIFKELDNRVWSRSLIPLTIIGELDFINIGNIKLNNYSKSIILDRVYLILDIDIIDIDEDYIDKELKIYGVGYLNNKLSLHLM